MTTMSKNRTAPLEKSMRDNLKKYSHLSSNGKGYMKKNDRGRGGTQDVRDKTGSSPWR